MAGATSYTAGDLEGFMEEILGPIHDALGIGDTDLLSRAVVAVERLLGSAIEDLTDMRLLEAAAEWKAWQAAESAAIGQSDLVSGAPGGGQSSIKRSQVWDHIQTKLECAYEGYQYARAAGTDLSAGTFAFRTVAGCRGR